MEPKQTGTTGGIENLPRQAGDYGKFSPSFEQGRNAEAERSNEPVQEVGLVQAEAAQVAMPALPAPVSVQQDDNAQGVTDGDDTPIVANDDDLIEKEWVDKAKKIISETREDPYRREREVNKLQIEYIRKRYGREIGDMGE